MFKTRVIDGMVMSEKDIHDIVSDQIYDHLSGTFEEIAFTVLHERDNRTPTTEDVIDAMKRYIVQMIRIAFKDSEKTTPVDDVTVDGITITVGWALEFLDWDSIVVPYLEYAKKRL